MTLKELRITRKIRLAINKRIDLDSYFENKPLSKEEILDDMTMVVVMSILIMIMTIAGCACFCSMNITAGIVCMGIVCFLIIFKTVSRFL